MPAAGGIKHRHMTWVSGAMREVLRRRIILDGRGSVTIPGLAVTGAGAYHTETDVYVRKQAWRLIPRTRCASTGSLGRSFGAGYRHKERTAAAVRLTRVRGRHLDARDLLHVV